MVVHGSEKHITYDAQKRPPNASRTGLVSKHAFWTSGRAAHRERDEPRIQREWPKQVSGNYEPHREDDLDIVDSVAVRDETGRSEDHHDLHVS